MKPEHAVIAHELVAINETLKAGFDWLRSHANLATKDDLKHLGELIMSKISDFADAVDAHNTAVDTAISGLTDDIANLNKQISDLQNSAGQITPEDQARLDAIQARSQTVADKLAALDALTPPVAPPTP